MKIEYNITKYFEENDLFKNNNFNNITITKDNGILTIKGSAKDLVELADIIVSVAKEENDTSHIHVDENTLINKNSDFKELIIEKII